MTILAVWTLMREGSNWDPFEVVARFGVLLAAYLAFTLVQRRLVHHPLYKSIGLYLNLLVLVILIIVCLRPILDQMNVQVGSAIKAGAVSLVVIIGLKLLDVLCFDWLARWRKVPQVPLVVRDIGRWVLVAVAVVLIVRGYFPGVNLNVLAVSSLVVGYIVGNATQETLGNLFAGLALNAERPFQIGDWVNAGQHTGVVVDTTWRATRLRTRAEDYIVIPNSAIAKESIINYSRPTRNHGCYLSVGVSYETPPNLVREVIFGVLREAQEVCQEPPPSVYLSNYGDFAINFTIKFFIEDFAQIDKIQSGVMDRLWYAFRREGISIPFPIRDIRHRDAHADERAQHAAEQEAIRQLLSGVDLFQSLSSEEIHRLVGGTRLKLFACGEKICRQGEAGDSFYVIRKGQVAVSMRGASGQPVKVGQLGSGAFFGEMSLLTGEPRAGTVTAETDVEVLCVSKQDFAGLLKANLDLAGKLAEVLEKRQMVRQTLLNASLVVKTVPETPTALAARILRFFGLS